jgi:hypothetical protein
VGIKKLSGGELWERGILFLRKERKGEAYFFSALRRERHTFSQH